MKILVTSIKLVLLPARILAPALKTFSHAGNFLSHSSVVENRFFFSISSISVTSLFTWFLSSNVICVLHTQKSNQGFPALDQAANPVATFNPSAINCFNARIVSVVRRSNVWCSRVESGGFTVSVVS